MSGKLLRREGGLTCLLHKAYVAIKQAIRGRRRHLPRLRDLNSEIIRHLSLPPPRPRSRSDGGNEPIDLPNGAETSKKNAQRGRGAPIRNSDCPKLSQACLRLAGVAAAGNASEKIVERGEDGGGRRSGHIFIAVFILAKTKDGREEGRKEGRKAKLRQF